MGMVWFCRIRNLLKTCRCVGTFATIPYFLFKTKFCFCFYFLFFCFHQASLIFPSWCARFGFATFQLSFSPPSSSTSPPSFRHNWIRFWEPITSVLRQINFDYICLCFLKTAQTFFYLTFELLKVFLFNKKDFVVLFKAQIAYVFSLII